MENDKDFLKSPVHDNSEPESTFTILPSGVNTDINLGSLGDVPDNMSVTVDAAALDPNMKVDGEYSSSQQTIMPENYVLVETSKGLILSVADASSDSINFSGPCIASVADEQGRPIISTSLPGTIFTQIQPVGVMDDHQSHHVYETVSGSNVVSSSNIPVFVDPDSTLNVVEVQQYVQQKKKGGGWPKGKKRKLIPDVQAPRKPMTGYVLFAVRRRKEIRAKNPELHFAEVTKVLGQEWSNLLSQDKNEYMKMAEEDKRRYIAEREEFQHLELYQAFLEYMKMAEEDKRRYIAEMEEFQHSELYQTFLKSKRSNGDITLTNPLIDLEENLGMNELYCKTCNQYFISSHNKKEHMFGRSHLQNIKNEIQKDIQQQAMLASSQESSQESATFNLNTAVPTVTSPPKPTVSPSLDINDFMMDFMRKNSERDREIKTLRRSRLHFENENIEITKQVKELDEYETKLDQDLGNLKAYGASLSAQIDALKMVPTLFGVINF